jgi:hypothetical protein
MLPLLTPQQIDQDKNGTANEIQRRVWGLAEEESELVVRVNTLRDTEIREKDRIARDFAADEKRFNAIVAALQIKVNDLEQRRERAMRPIEDLETEANKRIADVAERERSVEVREKYVRDQSSSLREVAEDQMEHAEDLARREGVIGKRERGALAEETRLKKSNDDLTAKWSDFHTAVYKKTEELARRESMVVMDTKANEIVAAELKAQRATLDARDIQIKDRYATLGLAIKEFEKKKKS